LPASIRNEGGNPLVLLSRNLNEKKRIKGESTQNIEDSGLANAARQATANATLTESLAGSNLKATNGIEQL
jgi:hypothetical protein